MGQRIQNQARRRHAPRWALYALDRLFAYDYFVSYAWADGRDYALALQKALEADGYEVFLDSKDYLSGDDWPEVGEAVLRRTTMLVLVGTEAATESGPALREVRLFREMGKRIVPIDVGGALKRLPERHALWDLLSSAVLRIAEANTAEPSPDTLKKIVAARTGELVAGRRLRAMRAAVYVLGALTALASALGGLSYAQRNRAQAAQREATRRAAELDWRLAETARSDTGTETPNPVRAARYLLQAAQLSSEAGDGRRAAEAVLAAENETRQLVWTARHGDHLQFAALHPGGARVLTGSTDGWIREWRVSDGAPTHQAQLRGTLT